MSNVLLENYLASQFKFGFELEAFVKDGWKEIIEDDDSDEYYWDDEFRYYEREEKDAKEVTQNCIADSFKLSPSDVIIKHDGSLEPDNNMDYAFEWATPTFQFTPTNLKKCIEGLNDLFTRENFYTGDKLFYTNESCGFHVHLSFPNISDKDCVWLISKLSVDNEMLGTLSGFSDFEFWNDDYADLNVFYEIGELIENGDIGDNLQYFFSTEKYRAFHIHPQGTIEWRGPRDFLNSYNKKNVYEFFKLLFKFVTWMSKTLADDNIVGFSKDHYFKLIYGESYKENDLISGFKYKQKQEKLSRKFNHIIKGSDASSIMKLIEKFVTTFDTKAKDTINNVLEKVDENSANCKAFIRDLLLRIINADSEGLRKFAFQFIEYRKHINGYEGFLSLSKEEMIQYFNKVLSTDSYITSITTPIITNATNQNVIEAFREALVSCPNQEKNAKAIGTLLELHYYLEIFGDCVTSTRCFPTYAIQTYFTDYVKDTADYLTKMIDGQVNKNAKQKVYTMNNRAESYLKICQNGYKNPILGSVLLDILNKIQSTADSYYGSINNNYRKRAIEVCDDLKNIVKTGHYSND